MPETLPLFCSFCGRPVVVTYNVTNLVPPQTSEAGIWNCPHTGCARENALSGFAVQSVLTADPGAARLAHLRN